MMIYRSMILSALLAPLMIIGDDAVDIRVQQLEEKLFQKELEVSRFGQEIAERDKLIVAYKSKAQEDFRLILDKKISELESKNDDKSLPEEKKSTLSKELVEELEVFYLKFSKAFNNKENITGMLVDNLFKENDFDSVKLYLILYGFEEELLKKVVKKYENLIQEIINLEIELESLKNSRV